MALIGIQILSLGFAAFMVYIAFIHLAKKEISRLYFFIWLGTWLIFSWFALYPKALDPIIARLNIVRAMDLLMIIAFMILAYLGFESSVKVQKMEKKIEELVRKGAFRNAKESRK